jgi:hypothetical protein
MIVSTKFVTHHQAKSKGTGSDNMNEIAEAAAAGSRNPNRSRTSNSGKITSDTGTIEKGVK